MDFMEYNNQIKEWTSLVIENRESNPELTLEYCNEIISYAWKEKDNKLLGFAYYYSGETYYCLNDGKNGLECFSRSISHLGQCGEWMLLVYAYNYMGIISYNRGNIPVAIDYYLKAIHYTERHGLLWQACMVKINLGSANMSCGRYTEAQEFLEEAYHYLFDKQEEERFYENMLIIYQNLAKCYVYQKNFEAAANMFTKIYDSLWEHIDEISRLSVLCVEAVYHHAVHNVEKRNQCIDQIQKMTTENVAIMDIFEDFYDYGKMLLETDRDDAFWNMVNMIWPIVEDSKIANLMLKVISLKIEYYRIHHEEDNYLRTAGDYYQISIIQKKETEYMMNIVINMRQSLEAANEKQKEMELENQKLMKKSEIDALTNLSNRYRLNTYAEEAFQRAMQNHTSLTFEILDIDYFKEYNDNYGHQKGDECLKQIAAAIKTVAARQGAFCSRYGGDEFVLIYEAISQEEAYSFAAEIKKEVMSQAIEHRYSKAFPIVTVSQGLCWDIPVLGNKVWNFLNAADNMLYKVKEVSRNNYRVGTLEDFKHRTGTLE